MNGTTNETSNGTANETSNGTTNKTSKGSTDEIVTVCHVHDGGDDSTVLQTRPYLDMSAQELERKYSPRFWTSTGLTPDQIIEKHMRILLQATVTAHATTPFSIGVSYGDTEKQKMDMLMPDSLPRDCPIFLYIHGGYWHLLGREYSSFMALPIYQAGGAVVAIGYDLCPDVSMEVIIEQVKRAVKYVLHIANHRESRGVYLGGHSAGGQLAAMMLTVDWLSETHVSPSFIKGALMLGGVFDVRPLVDTKENKVLKFDEQRAWECSPFKHISMMSQRAKNVELLVVNGSAESPEFIRQSSQYHQMLQAEGIKSEYLLLPGDDHFTMAERLTEPQDSLTQKVLSWMGLKQ